MAHAATLREFGLVSTCKTFAHNIGCNNSKVGQVYYEVFKKLSATPYPP